jgi:hypothetical protein
MQGLVAVDDVLASLHKASAEGPIEARGAELLAKAEPRVTPDEKSCWFRLSGNRTLPCCNLACLRASCPGQDSTLCNPPSRARSETEFPALEWGGLGRWPHGSSCGRGHAGQTRNYNPLVDIRMILTGFSSRISSTSRFPEKAATRASAARDWDDDFGSRSPPRRVWATVRPSVRLPAALSTRSVLAALADEPLPFFPIDFEDNNPLDVRFASLAKIAFVIAISFLALSSSNPKCANRDHAPTEGCNRRAMSKVMGFRERFQRSCQL